MFVRIVQSLLVVLAVLAWGCESPGRDEQDALDDTLGVVDTNILNSQDIGIHNDTDPDAPVQVDPLAGGPTVAIEQLAQAIAQWECKRIVSCGCSTTKVPKPDTATCVAQIAPAIAKTWGNGGLVARSDLITTCVNALEAASAPCAVAKLTSVTPCLAALRWPGKSGAACGTNGPFLCADGGVCEGGLCTGNPLSLLALDAKCSNPFVCGEAECLKDNGGVGHCQKVKPLKAACATSTECALPALCIDSLCMLPSEVSFGCKTTADCAPGLTCDAGKCAVPKTCTVGAECGAGGICVDVKADGNPLCEPPVCADLLAVQ